MLVTPLNVLGLEEPSVFMILCDGIIFKISEIINTISKISSQERIHTNKKLSFHDMFIRDNRGNYKNLY